MSIPVEVDPIGQTATLRRQVLIGGVALAATSLIPTRLYARNPNAFEGVIAKPGGTKPTYLPKPGSRDPIAHSIAENLFWNEQMMEHATFFIMLMPGPELAAQRAEAAGFRAMFANQLAKTDARSSIGNYRAFNRTTIDQVKRFVDFKHRMQTEQTAGRLKSLVWPTFFDHTAREGDYFIARLARLSAGDVAVDRAAATDFWARIMGEHADFIAHLLDPEERALVAKAMQTSKAFRNLRASRPPAPRATAIKAVDDIIDFKVAAEQGINTGKIRSIIHPTLADHVRREALKAADELRRAA